MKKLLLKLGTLSLAALPVLAIVSCGGSTSETEKDLQIRSKIVNQKTIDDAIKTYNAATTDDDKITALSTIFSGITTGNFKNFDVKATPTAESKPGKIVLTAKPGFIFGDQPTLSSWIIDEQLDLKITATPSTQTVINKAISDFNAATTDPAKITALSTIFSGITTANFKNFDVQATPTAESKPGKIVLTAKPGFTFSGQQTLSSALATTVDLNITATPSTQTVINKAITDFKAATTDPTKITALQPVFRGITTANFKNFDVTATATSGSTPGKIVLTAKSGFTFGGQQTLSSVIVVDLNITVTYATEAVINKAISDFKAATTDTTKIASLQTTFSGITTTNFKNFDVVATPKAGSTPGKIVLTAKSGFTFGGQPTLSSIINLPISPKPVAQSVVTAAIVSIINDSTTANKIRALQTIFNGVTAENFPYFDGSWRGPTGANVFYLKAKPGFTFNGKTTISSVLATQ